MKKQNKRLGNFFSYYMSYKRLLILDIASALLYTLIALVMPLFISHITKGILAGDLSAAPSQILCTGLIMVALALVQMVAYFFFDAKGHGMGAMMERDMREELYGHYLKLTVSFHNEQRPAKLMSRITNDLLQLTELYHHGPEDLMIYLVKFMGALAILFTINVRLALVVLVFMPLMILFTLYMNKVLKKSYKENFDRIADVNGVVEETLHGMPVVKSFANEAYEQKRFSAENNRFLKSRKKIYTDEAYMYVGVDTLTQFLQIAVVVIGGLLIAGEKLAIADLLVFILYIGYLVDPIPRLVNITRLYQEGITGYNRFMDIMEIEPEITDATDAAVLENVKGDILFEDVSFAYARNEQSVLEHISLHIRAGGYVALVGVSGVGKTTLCSLIPRFYDVTNGSLKIDGYDVRRVTQHSLRANIGVVQQDVYLFAGTVAENIGYGKLDANRDQVIEAAKKANAHEFIMALPQGYDTPIGYRGVRLSGGQKQRISIARVFLKDPAILILDEATSALDNESERVIQESLQELAQDRTTLVIAHRLSTIQNADEILVLHDKKIAEKGTHEQLLAINGIYAGQYGLAEK